MAAIAYKFSYDADQQRRADAAHQLTVASATPNPAGTSSQPATPATTAAASPAPSSTAPPKRTSVALPPASFDWPAAGFAVNIVPMDWDPSVPVNPALDANGFDPVGHWLKGSGQSDAVLPVVLSGHTCHAGVYLCNDQTFPFNRLSFDGWAIGQPATITDANGSVIPCTLQERSLVDKSKQFSFKNDPCLVVLFTCNFERPDDAVTLVTFRCGQCA
ncbi:hypothetical protein [Sinomonas sp. P10A9]|uniref:Uncharacterized protein n=1 Tax=Sinomonas puerhi TaxID=3238584 RepID=A0AB39L562_9MICC